MLLLYLMFLYYLGSQGTWHFYNFGKGPKVVSRQQVG